VELESLDGATLIIDALEDPAAVFAPLGERAAAAPLPDITPPRAATAAAALVTHLHRDHADAAAIASALADGGPVLEPPEAGGDVPENLALLQAEQELTAAGLDRRRLEPWEMLTAGPFTVTAVPAVDGLGDPQVSWLAEAGGVRVLHLGDTMFHGSWWRIARRLGPFDVVMLPVNGAVVGFPHRQPASPLPVAMSPEQAAVAAAILAPRLAVPIHADGYDVADTYRPMPGAAQLFVREARARGVDVQIPVLGEAVAADSLA
jgi:L-ascorbate metabolism protein UlaG (beta-lactamase superfamily)